jgi:hypothetical protein
VRWDASRTWHLIRTAPHHSPRSSFYSSRYNTSFQYDSISLFLCFVRFTKYFSLNENLFLLRRTLRRAAADLNVIAGLLMLFLMATLFMGNNILGPELEGYGPRNSAQFRRNSLRNSI